MKVLLTPVGTVGDVNPLLGIAHALAAPTVVPSTSDSKTTLSETAHDVRAPATRRSSSGRPSSS